MFKDGVLDIFIEIGESDIFANTGKDPENDGVAVFVLSQ